MSTVPVEITTAKRDTEDHLNEAAENLLRAMETARPLPRAFVAMIRLEHSRVENLTWWLHRVGNRPILRRRIEEI